MKILSIDPGYERLGIAVIEKKEGKKEELVFSKCFKTSSKDPHHQRLTEVSAEVEKIIKKYKPSILVTETLFFSKNVKTAMKVAEARGVIIERCSSNNLEIFELSPQQIKIAITGSGSGNKNQIIKMVPLLINVSKEKKNDDEYDAIAIGLTFFAIKNNF